MASSAHGNGDNDAFAGNDSVTGNERKRELKQRLANHTPTEPERLVIQSAIFNIVTMASIGAASLGVSAQLLAKARRGPGRTAIPTLLGMLTGIGLGGSLGVDRGMRKLREDLPPDSELRGIIHEFYDKE